MSKNFEKIKKWYKMKIYTEKHLKLFVEKGQITPEEYELITGEPYEE
ncbi:XkdX family protein [Butyrivibrio sp.]|nr:XkdX family protein [Butyrivibrio sp.]MBQ9302017.1 XkdX family protein [Butyrivibrio sp.]